jgi:hypothetical protein
MLSSYEFEEVYSDDDDVSNDDLSYDLPSNKYYSFNDKNNLNLKTDEDIFKCGPELLYRFKHQTVLFDKKSVENSCRLTCEFIKIREQEKLNSKNVKYLNV